MKKSLTSEAPRTNFDDFKKEIVPLLGIQPEELKARSQRGICTCVLKAALFTIDKRRKQHKCQLTDDERIKKMKYIYTISGLSKFKKKKILSHAPTWINFENIMVNEISQSQKDKHCDSSRELSKNNRINKNIK